MVSFRYFGAAATLAVLVSAGGCESVRSYSGLKQPAARCETLQFPIYFQTGSDALTGPAREMITTTAKQAKACKVAQVQVVGLADADGSAARNLELSRQRAQIV